MTYKERINNLLEKAFEEGREYSSGITQNGVYIPATHNLENIAVRGFMSKTYPDGYAMGNGGTYVNDYLRYAVEGDAPSWTEMTNPLMVGMPGMKVKLTRNGKVTQYEGGQPIYNLVPGQTYMCQVLDRNGEELAKGEIKTTGTVRMIMMTPDKPVSNIRDIGGYKCNGGHLAYEKVLRSAYLHYQLEYDSENARILRDIGVTAELDLRGEWTKDDLGWKGYSYSGSDYANLLKNPVNLKAQLTAIANTIEAGGCILIHCYAGADRTGTLAAILQLMCGVSESDVIHDWEMTSFCSWFNFLRITDDDALRAFLRKLNTYTGKNYQEKMVWWLRNKAKISESLITRLQRCLIAGM